MISNKIGFAAVTFCLLLFIQVGCSPSAFTNDTNGTSLVSSESSEIASFENTNPVSILPATVSEPMVPHGSGTVAIIVQNSLYPNITAAVSQYRQDLNDTGYHTILCTDVISTAEELKFNLSQCYDSDGLVGAVLIGRLPYAQFYHDDSVTGFADENFICDLFLTDLDGTWGDVSPTDGIYDIHSASPNADISPEIFLGRIDPTCLSWGSSVADHVNTYLARIHNYRTGGVTRNRQALFYVDDDWIPWASAWSYDAAPAYETRTVVYSPGSTTTATDWLNNRVNSDYQWGHLAAHSSPTTHYFGPGGSGEGTVSSSQIQSAPPSFNFYNLFCCSGAAWTISDNIGVTYTFSGIYSLATIGSSKTGSMLDNDEFYGPLGQNATLGESLRDWSSEALSTSSEAGAAYVQWHYGINIIGDPLLSLYYDCTALPPTIISDTHPNQGQWYTNQKPQINWTIPVDVQEITGYYYVVDQNPTTAPDKDTGTYTTTNGTLATEDLTSGTWYYHVVSVDSVGNIGEEAAHYAVNIDVTSPEVTLIYPTLNGYSSSDLTAIWTFNDDYSGHARSIVWIDSSSNIVHNDSALECTISGLTEGSHVINITSYDEAMNRVSLESIFNIDLTDPVLTIISPIDGDSISTTVILEWDASDADSGYQLSEIFLDGLLIGITYAPNSTLVVSDLSYGEHIFRITVYDWANNTSSEEVVVTVQQPLPDTLLLVSVGIIIGLIIILVIVSRRRG